MPKLAPGSKPKAPPYGVRISEAAKTKLRRDAARKGMTVPDYLEELIMEADLTQTNYFAQQAALQSFVAVRILMALASQSLSPDVTRQVRAQAAAFASALYGGEVQPRPSSIGDVPPDEDARVLALFAAFGAG